MGGPVIETIRPGVQFTPEAAAAFRRAEAQVRAELGRNIDVNSTYRDYNLQLSMWRAWQAYAAGRGPHPGHSKALHPDDPLAFHTKGLALDSDDWTNGRVVQILAEHGFIRNRLYVPNENHHFEYLRDRDQHRYDPAPAGHQSTPTSAPEPQSEEDDMPKNSGVYYDRKNPDGTTSTVYLVFNTGSGFQHEFSAGPGKGNMNPAYNNALAKALDTPSWAKVTEGHARVIKRGLAAVTNRDVSGDLTVTIDA